MSISLERLESTSLRELSLLLRQDTKNKKLSDITSVLSKVVSTAEMIPETELAQKPATTVAPVTPAAPVTDASVDSVVTAVESVIDSVNATDNEVIVAAEAPLGQAQFYEEDDAGFDMRSVYAAIVILFVAIFALVCFLIRRKKNL